MKLIAISQSDIKEKIIRSQPTTDTPAIFRLVKGFAADPVFDTCYDPVHILRLKTLFYLRQITTAHSDHVAMIVLIL